MKKLIILISLIISFSSLATELVNAVQSNNIQLAKKLIEEGIDINQGNYFEETPLFWACWKGNLKMVKLLISNGAKVNKADEDGDTPLHFAAYKGHLETVKFLIEKGAKVNKTNDDGETALVYAFQLKAEGGEETEITEFLKSKGARRGSVSSALYF